MNVLLTSVQIFLALNMMDQEMPDYDMDSEDEAWLNKQRKKMDINPLQFEEMIDRLEKGSGQQVISLFIVLFIARALCYHICW